LLDAIRLIEEDPDLLSCILMLLDREIVPRSELPLPLSPDLDPLYLTGVVERVQGDAYRLQNLIYRSFLAEYFYPGRVGHMLAMAGRWDSAIDYLEAGLIGGDEASRADLLPATINSMHAAEDLNQAAHFLARGLSAAFGVGQVQVWYAPPQENCLRLIGGLGGSEEGDSWAHHEMPLGVDRLEARTYRQATPLRASESSGHIWRAIPLMIPGRAPLGVVTLREDRFPEKFSQQRERELQILGYLNQAARAIQAVSTRRQELALAGRMQASLLPESLPVIPGWGLAAVWRPARETSGDFYDFIPLPAGRLGIVIADVVDKGIGAALYMALSRTLIRTYAADHPDCPGLVLGAANQRILAEAEVGQFVTAFYAILDPATGDLVYCNAGHNPPYLLGSGSIEVLHRTGMALGVSEGANWESQRVVLTPGAAMLMYTDGLVDALNPGEEPFGSQRLLESAQQGVDRSAQELQESLIAGVYAFMGGGPQVDDMTLVVVRRDP
jgi:serine phosphatase RsbU (regulator of sigma subunit)